MWPRIQRITSLALILGLASLLSAVNQQAAIAAQPKITMDAKVLIHGAGAEDAPEIDTGPLQVNTVTLKNGIVHQVYDQSNEHEIFQTYVDDAYNGYIKLWRRNGVFEISALMGGFYHYLLNYVVTREVQGDSATDILSLRGSETINMYGDTALNFWTTASYFNNDFVQFRFHDDPDDEDYAFLGRRSGTYDTRLGIGTKFPGQALDVNGVVKIQNVWSAPSTSIGHGCVYSVASEIYAKDGSGNENQLTSHADPAKIANEASTSFGDPGISLPYSIHHRNVVLGTGEIIDLAKMVRYVENRMQAELGAEQGRLVYEYEVPKSTVADRIDMAEQESANAVAMAVLKKGWIDVPLGDGGRIPPEALEETAEFKSITKSVAVTEPYLDLENDIVTTRTLRVMKIVQAPTGKMVKKLKDNYRFHNGKIQRKATMDDIDLAQVIQPLEQATALPDWIELRLPQEEKSIAISQDEFQARVALAAKDLIAE